MRLLIIVQHTKCGHNILKQMDVYMCILAYTYTALYNNDRLCKREREREKERGEREREREGERGGGGEGEREREREGGRERDGREEGEVT